MKIYVYIFSYEKTLLLYRPRYTVYDHRLDTQKIGLRKMTTQGKSNRTIDLAEHFLSMYGFFVVVKTMISFGIKEHFKNL